MNISGDPSKYGLINVPGGKIGHSGESRLMTFSGRSQTTSQRTADTDRQEMTNTSGDLSIPDIPPESEPVFIKHGEVIPKFSVPKYLTRDNVFITMVEWPLRPGDTRAEAYFIGKNSTRQHCFLLQCIVDDLSPYIRKFLSRRTIAMVEKGRLKIQESAALLFSYSWQYEKETWGTPPFFLVSDSGLLDMTTTHES